MAACRAGQNCITKTMWAKVYLGKSNVRPPKSHYLALLHDDGTEVEGPSYRRECVRFTSSDKGGYANNAPISFRPTHVDENWNTVALSRIVQSATPTDGECTCFTVPLNRPRRVEAGDILLWERGNLRVALGGRLTTYVAGLMNDFLFGGLDFVPPSEFYAALFSARPNPDKFVELSGPNYERRRIRFTHGRDGLTPHSAHDVRWTSPGDWDVAGLGIFDTADPFAEDGHLWSWRQMPFGGRVVEKGDDVVQLAGTWGLA